jgi:hypothetical protein
MSVENASQSTSALLRLRVTAEADPGALARVLERFQILNVLPRCVVAEFGVNDVLHIQIDIVGMDEARLSNIAAKLCQITTVLGAYWHYV